MMKKKKRERKNARDTIKGREAKSKKKSGQLSQSDDNASDAGMKRRNARANQIDE